MIFAFVLLLVNFLISWGNASYCGRYWTESKQTGGFFRINVIAGYIMSIAGFTMVYGYLLLLASPYVLPLFVELSNEQLMGIMQLSSDMLYLLILLAVIPTGFFIWFNSLAVFWKRKTLGNGLTAGWNTYAQFHNVISASREAPSAFKRVSSSLFGGSRKKNKDNIMVALAIIVLLLAIFGGYFTASAIMKKADREYDAFAV